MKYTNKYAKRSNLRTINGVYKADGMIKIKIFNIEKYVNVFLINNENFKYNFLIGLDCIQKLIQNENLEIEQKDSEPKKLENEYERNSMKILMKMFLMF